MIPCRNVTTLDTSGSIKCICKSPPVSFHLFKCGYKKISNSLSSSLPISSGQRCPRSSIPGPWRLKLRLVSHLLPLLSSCSPACGNFLLPHVSGQILRLPGFPSLCRIAQSRLAEGDESLRSDLALSPNSATD